MNRNQVVGVVIAAIVVIALVLVLVMTVGRKSQQGAGEEATTTEQGPATSKTLAPISDPKSIVIPNHDTQGVAANVAIPTSVVVPAAPGVTASFRGYDIKVEGDKFMPDTIVVKAGDTVHAQITAVDKDYDFTQPDYGLKLNLPKGQPKILEFAAVQYSGNVTFYCAKCGGPEKGPVGHILVIPK